MRILIILMIVATLLFDGGVVYAQVATVHNEVAENSSKDTSVNDFDERYLLERMLDKQLLEIKKVISEQGENVKVSETVIKNIPTTELETVEKLLGVYGIIMAVFTILGSVFAYIGFKDLKKTVVHHVTDNMADLLEAEIEKKVSAGEFDGKLEEILQRRVFDGTFDEVVRALVDKVALSGIDGAEGEQESDDEGDEG